MLQMIFNWCLCVCLPCKVDDEEEWGEGVISGIPVVSNEGVLVGAILTANHDVHRMYS